MAPPDEARLRHILDTIAAAARFVKGRTRADLEHDEMLLFALVRAVEIVGEAAGKISVETRAAIQEVPWSAAAAMRNRLVHAYFDVDRDVLWNTVVEALPALRRPIETHLKGL